MRKTRKTPFSTFLLWQKDVSCLHWLFAVTHPAKRAVFKSFKSEYLCSVVLLVKIYIGEKNKGVKDY